MIFPKVTGAIQLGTSSVSKNFDDINDDMLLQLIYSGILPCYRTCLLQCHITLITHPPVQYL